MVTPKVEVSSPFELLDEGLIDSKDYEKLKAKLLKKIIDDSWIRSNRSFVTEVKFIKCTKKCTNDVLSVVYQSYPGRLFVYTSVLSERIYDS